ncbi:hypothetical protein L1887_01904 [Cichorium endivia]|nr:hypothetical protein L1887_01904 [Cichorium endivia]
MSDLPRDVLVSILSRLPAKSLGQFKSVSKYWFSLISSADFVKSHHLRAISDTNNNHSRAFIMSTHSMHSVDFESPACYEGTEDDPKAIVSLKDPLTKESVGERLFGSCYGLIYFVCFNECILLWNPTTQKTRLIPDLSTSFSGANPFYGLGYDVSTDDYKMVRASRSVSGQSIRSEVFNLKTGSWRTIHASQIDIDESDEIGIFSNGTIHWLIRHVGGSERRDTILTFDSKKEIFGEISLPNREHEETGFTWLGDLRGCLYAVCGGDGADVDVWVMKEYGVENSWSKMIKLNWVEFDCDYVMLPVCFTLKDEVVIDLDSWNIVRYNLTEKTIKYFKKCSTDWHDWVMYTETLVSPLATCNK